MGCWWSAKVHPPPNITVWMWKLILGSLWKHHSALKFPLHFFGITYSLHCTVPIGMTFWTKISSRMWKTLFNLFIIMKIRIFRQMKFNLKISVTFTYFMLLLLLTIPLMSMFLSFHIPNTVFRPVPQLWVICPNTNFTIYLPTNFDNVIRSSRIRINTYMGQYWQT